MTKVALLGSGYWGRNLARNFAKLGALASVSDIDKNAAETVAANAGGVPVRPLDDVLADSNVRSVAISTPAITHASLVERALLAGKHVFVEKPLALQIQDAHKLCDLAQSTGRILMVGHLLQYHPAFIELRRQCLQGRIGRLQYVYSNRLNLGKVRTEENILWSFAPHDISMILALLGQDLTSVSAIGHCYLHKAIADVTTTHLTFSSGQAAHIHVSWLHPFKEQRLVVVGEGGMMVFDDRMDWNEKLKVYPHRIGWSNGIPIPERADAIDIELTPAEPLLQECRHFLDCMDTGAQPITDGREGLRVLTVLDAAQRSLECGQPVSMTPIDPRDYFVHETAVIDTPCAIGAGTRIWHFSHVLKNSRIGKDCNIGQNVVIGPDVSIGDRCKIQNNVSVYPGVTLEDGVFCGPSMVFTNVFNPRAEIERKHEYRPTLVRRGATIGANATVVCGATIGRYALIGAGAVVIRDVPDFALMVGNPARRVGWVCSCGVKLPADPWHATTCPDCGKAYVQDCGSVREKENEE